MSKHGLMGAKWSGAYKRGTMEKPGNRGHLCLMGPNVACPRTAIHMDTFPGTGMSYPCCGSAKCCRASGGRRSNPGVQFRRAPFRFIFTKEGGRIIASAAPGDWRRVHDLRVVEMLSSVPMGSRRVRAQISRREYDALKRYLYAEGINHTDRTGEHWERQGWKA